MLTPVINSGQKPVVGQLERGKRILRDARARRGLTTFELTTTTTTQKSCDAHLAPDARARRPVTWKLIR